LLSTPQHTEGGSMIPETIVFNTSPTQPTNAGPHVMPTQPPNHFAALSNPNDWIDADVATIAVRPSSA